MPANAQAVGQQIQSLVAKYRPRVLVLDMSRVSDIEYSAGPAEWETGRRLWEARTMLDERFLLLYSDNFVPFNLDKLAGNYF